MSGNLRLEKGTQDRLRKEDEVSCRGTGRLQWREQSVRRFLGGQDAAWARDASRFARKMKSLCLALPFLESR